MISFCGDKDKDKVFTNAPQTIEALRQIIDEFTALRQRPEIITDAMRDMHRQTILCVARNGGHVKGGV